MSDDDIALQADNLPDTSKYRPKYTPISQVEALLKKGLSHTQIGKLLNISYVAVGRLIQRHGLDPVEDKHFKNNRADILASKQRLLINNITVSSVKKMAVRDNVVSFGILYDKERLERGLSTENIAYDSTITKIDDRSSEIARLKQLLNIQEVEGTYQIQPDNDPDNDDPLPPNEH